MPLTAAMTGFQRSFDLGPSHSPGSSKWNGVAPNPMYGSPPADAPVGPSSICSMRSMPVQNALSPAPVSTMQRTSSWRRRSRQMSRTSRSIVMLNALYLSGRFRVTVATPSASV